MLSFRATILVSMGLLSGCGLGDSAAHPPVQIQYRGVSYNAVWTNEVDSIGLARDLYHFTRKDGGQVDCVVSRSSFISSLPVPCKALINELQKKVFPRLPDLPNDVRRITVPRYLVVDGKRFTVVGANPDRTGLIVRIREQNVQCKSLDPVTCQRFIYDYVHYIPTSENGFPEDLPVDERALNNRPIAGMTHPRHLYVDGEVFDVLRIDRMARGLIVKIVGKEVLCPSTDPEKCGKFISGYLRLHGYDRLKDEASMEEDYSG